MTIDEIGQLIHSAPPGTQFEIVRITTPLVPCASPTHEASVDAPTGDCDWTPSQVVAWAREHHPSGLKVREWAAMPLGVSKRQMEAAVAAGELEWYPQARGAGPRRQDGKP